MRPIDEVNFKYDSMCFQVLGMDPLPAAKYQQRQWRFTRKRRRSGTEANDSEGMIFLKKY